MERIDPDALLYFVPATGWIILIVARRPGPKDEATFPL